MEQISVCTYDGPGAQPVIRSVPWPKNWNITSESATVQFKSKLKAANRMTCIA